MKGKGILGTNFPNLFLHAAENLAASQQHVMNHYSSSNEEQIQLQKKFSEMTNGDYQESEEDEYSPFNETFDILKREAMDLKNKANILFDLNLISEKEYLEFIVTLEREEDILKQCDDY